MPCRAWKKVSPGLQWVCVSIVDPERPGWYATVRPNGDIYYEPEYAPLNPETFDDDASFIAHRDKFFPGFGAFESHSMPNHFARATADGRFAFIEFEDTQEFRNAASNSHVDSRSLKGKSTCFLSPSVYIRDVNRNVRFPWE